MSVMRRKILVVDDDPAMCAVMTEDLDAQGYQTTASHSGDEAFCLLLENDFDAVVTDLNMGGLNGVELCDRIVKNRPDIPVIVITGFGSMDTAIATLRAGAYDFLTKPFEMEQLVLSLGRAIQHRDLTQEVERLRKQVSNASPSKELQGNSTQIRRVFDLINRIAPTDATVLLVGETGTGKELAARAIHAQSGRSTGPLVTINCSAIPENLLESELFGHVRGAFTDARADRKGLFLEAENGTLFLDEIGDMPMSMQVKLLRVLESRAVRPVGGNQEIPCDVRLIAATHRDLVTAVEEGVFREDLYYRINVVQVDLPPLRSRGDDILLIAQTILASLAQHSGKPPSRLPPAVAEKLLSYSWPGNVRELRNCMERAVALARFDELLVEDLPEHIRQYRSAHVLVTADIPEELVSLIEVEKRYIQRVMEAVQGNKRQAAKILGLDRTTLYRKLEKYGIIIAHDPI